MKAWYKYVVLLFLGLWSTGLWAQQEDAVQEDTAEITVVPAYDDLPEVTVSSGEDLSRFVIPKEVYRNFKDERNWRKLPGDTLRSFEKDPDFWYANYPFKEEPPQTQTDRSSGSNWISSVLWIIILGAFMGILVWFLSQNGIGFFKNDTQLKKGENLEDTEEEDIFHIAYGQKIEKAEQEGNYRLAVRYLFLQFLKDLSEKGAIQYKPDRTNLDYLLQLHGKLEYNGFFKAARHYDYCWYGQFIPNKEAYAGIRQFFDALQKKRGVI